MLSDELVQIGLDVSRETVERIEKYRQLLLKWAPAINLIGKGTRDDVVRRHILDCAQLIRFGEPEARKWCDLGSGAGLPGVVIAILGNELAPEMSVAMIESDRRKVAFLQICRQETGLDFEILCDRIECVPGQDADIVSARALAPLARLLGLVARHIAPPGRALLPKGKDAEAEIVEAAKGWHFVATSHRSVTNNEARILEFRNIRRKDLQDKERARA